MNFLSFSAKAFPTIFKPFLENTQKLCLGNILNDNNSYESLIVKSSINCLSNTMNSSTKNNNSVEYWKSNISKIIKSLNYILDNLFKDIVEEGKHITNIMLVN